MKKIILIVLFLVCLTLIVKAMSDYTLTFRYDGKELILIETEALQLSILDNNFVVDIGNEEMLNSILADIVDLNYTCVDEECNDGLFCNGIEQCIDNVCQPGIPPDCNDAVSCTIDSCNEATDSCINAPTDSLCNDGLWCNGAETCDALLDCQAGIAPNCLDSYSCTTDICNEAEDKCNNIANDANCDVDEICDPEIYNLPTGCGIPPTGEILLDCPMEDRYKTCADGTTNSRGYYSETSDTVGPGVIGNGHIAVTSHQTRVRYSTSNHIDRYEGTIEFWARADVDVSGSLLKIRPNNDNTIRCSFSSSDNRVRCGAWGSGVGRWSYIYSDPWDIGEWHHVKITYSKLANEMNVYYDNVLVGTKQFAGFESSILNTGLWLNEYCSGCAISIDEFKIWDYTEGTEIPPEPPEEPIEGLYAITDCDSCNVKSINIEGNTVNFEDYSDGSNMGKTTFILCGVNGVNVNFNCNNVIDSSENVWDSSLLKPKASYDNETWFLITDTTYNDAGNKFSFTQTFDQDCVMISSVYYYPTYRMYNFASALDESDLWDVTHIGNTDLGKKILLIEGTDSNYAAENKKHIWMIAGQHPQETSGVYQLEALLKKFETTDYGKDLFIHAVLIMNLDGMYLGLPRDDQSGVDLNRAWDDYSSEVVNIVRPLIIETNNQYEVDMFIDFHGYGGTTHLESNILYCSSIPNDLWNKLDYYTTYDDKVEYGCTNEMAFGYAKSVLDILIALTPEMSQINQDNNIAVFTSNGEGFLDAIYEYFYGG